MSKRRDRPTEEHDPARSADPRTPPTSPTPALTDLQRAFVASLSPEERLLVILKAQLYDGRWDLMSDDLRNRLQGRPFIFKLINRISDDLARIERLAAFEKRERLDLSGLVPAEALADLTRTGTAG